MIDEHRFTDVGNARRLVARFGHRLRYVPAWSAWLVYDGARWARDDRGQVVEDAKAIGAQLWDDAREMAGGEKANATRWALASEGMNRVDAMVRLARTEPGMSVLPDELDRDPMVLNVTNGTIDLRTGMLRPHDPADLITKVAPVDYDPPADCPAWRKFLEQVVPDAEVRDYLRIALGYSLTGRTTEHALMLIHGPGGTGKTTFLSTAQRVMGDYAIQASSDVLMAGDAHPTGVADLQGARMVVAAETDQGRKLAEGLVKQLTGGDRIKARFMRQDFFQFDPTHTLWLSTNHRPVITGTDRGIWRRVKLIPFLVTIPEEHQDRDLVDHLEDEAAGILNWMVAGCREWQQTGLRDPAAVLAAVADYRAEMDTIGTFIDEAATLHPDARVSALDLYKAYTSWCDDAGERPLTQGRLGSALTERGLDRRKFGQTRRWHWFGIGLGTGGVDDEG